MIYIAGITSDKIDDVWDRCSKFIEMGINHSQCELSTMDYYDRLVNQEMQLWVVYDEEKQIKCALTTEVIEYPRKKVCRIVSLGGRNLDEWVERWLDILERWAEENDCDSIETYCRKGFIKKLEKFGYTNTYTVLGKELTTVH
jgi:hypothetical protein|tara:strand:- start:6306 stop:6734 length:429 start_codon:yes stop_codon:yes gene_type:complete